ncbi:ribosome small subunit-dependent GTPase A [Rhodobacter sp. Har01]|uniref:ribosome small subunit-dependent GTPase A n=1 Tax=Rhodobacter sp. Har01 TaxID=2883999 RepID=UPI001D071573|nr:ribosome small subunit-dependent GTPase A [Rhodobacter sp. Har01]MCB6179385.1 ribosome small subunit-dependent GTPase A [Rhodobacter sp. Har01]
MTHLTLDDLGWSPHFAAQITADDGSALPLRLIGVQRNRATGLGPGGPLVLEFPPGLTAGEVAVGDWALANPETRRILRVLERRSLLERKAAGIEVRPQLIAANVDTLFIVTSCNADFNLARLERYVALALDSGTTPVIVLTKADLAPDAEAMVAEAKAISPRIAAVLALNAKQAEALDVLRPWCGQGQTVAFVGSSGVGKSTLISGLAGIDLATAGIREDDAKGHHTTTARSLHLMPGGGLLIDMPGMRELALFDAAEGIAELYDDIEALAGTCRFRDCSHGAEPGCAVQAAIAAGVLEAGRFGRWQKLQQEDARTNTSLLEARRRDKAFGRMIKAVKKDMKRR